MENAIELKNIKKIFRYFKKDYMVFYWLFTKKGYTKQFKVLNGITWNVKKGEVVGILGKNGAGKSTLLKIISGIYFPTSGTVNVNGTIASLIELSAGFNKELTGRENIYLKGNLIGLSNQYIEDNIDSMIEFADIGEYIDMPLGTYSSGMSARLGFALAVNADPDILIIDEVFAVGDKNFQKKSRAKTEELMRSGKTVLFVSHSEALIKQFCHKVVYLKNGKIVYDGDVKRGLAVYHADNLNLEREPILSFLESEIAIDNENHNSRIRLRFEYGIGAGNKLVDNDKFSNFEFIASKYIVVDENATEYGFADVEIDKVNDELVDIYLELADIIDNGYFTINFKHNSYKDNEKITTAVFSEKNRDEGDNDYEITVKNVNEQFAFQVNTRK